MGDESRPADASRARRVRALDRETRHGPPGERKRFVRRVARQLDSVMVVEKRNRELDVGRAGGKLHRACGRGRHTDCRADAPMTVQVLGSRHQPGVVLAQDAIKRVGHIDPLSTRPVNGVHQPVVRDRARIRTDRGRSRSHSPNPENVQTGEADIGARIGDPMSKADKDARGAGVAAIDRRVPQLAIIALDDLHGSFRTVSHRNTAADPSHPGGKFDKQSGLRRIQRCASDQDDLLDRAGTAIIGLYREIRVLRRSALRDAHADKLDPGNASG